MENMNITSNQIKQNYNTTLLITEEFIPDKISHYVDTYFNINSTSIINNSNNSFLINSTNEININTENILTDKFMYSNILEKVKDFNKAI